MENREGHRIQDAQPEGEGSAYGSRSLETGRLFFTVQAATSSAASIRKCGAAPSTIEAPTLNSRPVTACASTPRLPYSTSSQQQDRPSIEPKDAGHREYEAAGEGREAAPHRDRQGRHRVVRTTTRAAFLGHLIRRPGRSRSSRRRRRRAMPYAIGRHRRRRGLGWGDRRRFRRTCCVRSNPEAEEVMTWPVSGRRRDGPQHGHIDKTGNLWLAESGVGKLARVTIKRGSGRSS